MDSANFIPLGEVNRVMAFDTGEPRVLGMEGRERKVGSTKEEKKQIAREIRLAARREKKKIKSDAKKQRKQNAIMNRRMTRNNEKYVKNKDRNKQRAIDLERNKIRFGAVKQCERLAALHDPTGKLFNVGEVVTLPDGKVKSKAMLERALEEKKKVDEILQLDAAPTVDGINPDRLAHIQGDTAAVNEQKRKNVSRKQQKLQEALAPKPVPPKPVIPEGYSLPAGEENLLALWDITDEQIIQRLGNAKKEKSNAAKHLRAAQKEKKKLNRAIKALKKEAANKGILWDPEAARKEVLGEGRYILKPDDKEEGSDSDSDSSSSDSESDGEVEWESDDDVKVKKAEKKDKKRTKSSTSQDADGVMTKNFPNRPKLNMALLKDAEDIERQLLDKKRRAREARKLERKEIQRKIDEDAKKKAEEEEKKKAEEAAAIDVEMADEAGESDKKKRKRKAEAGEPSTNGGQEKKQKREHKSKSKDKKAAKQRPIDAEHAAAKAAKAAPVSNDDKLDALIAERNQLSAETPSEAPKEKKRKRDKKAPDVETIEQESVVLEPISEESLITERTHKKSKKEKTPKITEEIPAPEISEESESATAKAERKQRKKEKKAAKEAATNGAEQWNPDALNGDDARKDKFLRLLGAGKSGGVVVIGEGKKKREGSGNVDEIRKAELELERQFEAGVKLKHDGGGKRRGLGA